MTLKDLFLGNKNESTAGLQESNAYFKLIKEWGDNGYALIPMGGGNERSYYLIVYLWRKSLFCRSYLL